ncbi:hypothetical protein [Rathayibacter sp. VKM Ac-2857]|uniref:SecDF P1 head subdomain-containing protein n=1 Tax=Rathayibacter sp. VKM Ac-2857 TaxID=2739020 RepID=UPI001563AA5A|nr:hypothetical protein [Rathayibacter sp. VKM Ac-2857]NQX17211.1 hypothetical protein [Rathayibacter sp. VKM Ac-2857]
MGILVLALAGCASPADPEPEAAGGGLDIAVSSVCEVGADPQCTAVGGQDVLVDPAAFTRAGVASVEVSGTGDAQTVDVRFDEDGAELFQDATAEAAGAGPDARLLLRAGDVVVSAVAVMQAIEGDSVQILPGDEDAQDLADRIGLTRAVRTPAAPPRRAARPAPCSAPGPARSRRAGSG